MSFNARLPRSANWRVNIILFMISQFLTGITSMVVQYSIIWYLTFQTDSATILSVATLLGMIPMILLGPFIGGYVDRLNKKALLIVPDVVAAVVAVILSSTGVILGYFPLALVFVSLLIRSIAQTFQMPTVQSIIPAMVPVDQVTRVNGQLGMVQSAIFIISPALGAWFFTFIPINGLILADVVGAIFGVGILLFVAIPKVAKTGEKTHVVQDAIFGFKSLKSNRGIWTVTIGGTLFMLGFMPAISMYPLMTTQFFHGDVWQVGLIEVIYSLGMLMGGAFIGFFGTMKDRMPFVIFSFFGVGVTFGISGLLTGDFTGFVWFAILNAIGGIVGSLFNILFMAVVQQSYPPEELGRVMSVMNTFMSLGGPVGLLFAGPLADAIGVEKLFLIAGIIATLAGIGAVLSPHVRRIDIDLHERLAREAIANAEVVHD